MPQSFLGVFIYPRPIFPPQRKLASSKCVWRHNFCIGSLVSSSKPHPARRWARDQRILMTPSLDWDHMGLNKPALELVILGLNICQIEFLQTACTLHLCQSNTEVLTIWKEKSSKSLQISIMLMFWRKKWRKKFFFFKERGKVHLSGRGFQVLICLNESQPN